MFHHDENRDSGRIEPPWRLPPRFEARPAAMDFWLRRLSTDMRRVLRNETETRRFLAREVYRVPEDWLDEVIRVRLTDLVRD